MSCNYRSLLKDITEFVVIVLKPILNICLQLIVSDGQGGFQSLDTVN